MNYYCDLFIRSNLAELPSGLLRPDRRSAMHVEDLRSAKNLARAERLGRIASGVRFVQRADLPRYVWSLSSKGAVVGPDPYEHVAWLCDHLHPGAVLKDLPANDFEFGFSFYWGGHGTGGGPLVAPRLSQLLLDHGANLDIGFHFEAMTLNA
jgi:hypothetical protein